MERLKIFQNFKEAEEEHLKNIFLITVISAEDIRYMKI
nr:MAG TPA: hypothetical protein [Bacteriophage sp.]DAI57770.1 MAG TPA: hypothetical protein [Caudoviricetes sp.]